MEIRPERERDQEAVLELNRLAFDGEAEADLIQNLREDGHVRLSLVAEEEDEIVGHILFSQITILTLDDNLPALALAPMSVTPERQREGIGSQLVEEGLRMSRDHGHRAVLVLGHREYYPRFGFSPDLVSALACPYAGPHFMGLELASGALEGVEGEVLYSRPFLELE